MAAHTKKHEPEGFVGKNPGIVSAIFAILVAAGFIGLLIAGSGDHAGHGSPTGQHSSTPAAGGHH